MDTDHSSHVHKPGVTQMKNRVTLTEVLGSQPRSSLAQSRVDRPYPRVGSGSARVVWLRQSSCTGHRDLACHCFSQLCLPRCTANRLQKKGRGLKRERCCTLDRDPAWRSATVLVRNRNTTFRTIRWLQGSNFYLPAPPSPILNSKLLAIQEAWLDPLESGMCSGRDDPQLVENGDTDLLT